VKEEAYDLVIIGAGSGGLIAAGFAARLGAKVTLVEKHRIGGDCTWTGCVPSKALLKAAKVAHEVRTASHYGVGTNPPVVDMGRVREYVRAAIQQVYQFESPEELQRQGVDVIIGGARFLDSRTIAVGERTIRSKTFLLTTGARPAIPPIAGLNEVPFLTYEQIFDNDRLPRAMVVVGGAPIGVEMAQAYQRLGANVSVSHLICCQRKNRKLARLCSASWSRKALDSSVGGPPRRARTETTSWSQPIGKRLEGTFCSSRPAGDRPWVASTSRTLASPTPKRASQ